MARPIRVEFAGAVYHVMARGNERQAIFRDDTDRRLLRVALAEMVERFGVRLHAYCWMPNHYHLVLATPRANLSRAMGWLQTTYTARFNARHRRSGHLFQGRFKAHLVDADEYARWLVEYVHLNPVRPRKRAEPIPPERAEELARFDWSSHRDYAGTRKKSPPWLCLDWLAYWGRSRRGAQAEYRKAIRRAFGEAVSSPWQQLRRGLVLGSEQLYQRARDLMEKKTGLEEAAWTEAEEAAAVLKRVRELIKSETDERLKIWARVRVGGERGVDLAREYAYRGGAGVRQVVRRLESSANRDTKLKAKLEGIKRRVKRAQ